MYVLQELLETLDKASETLTLDEKIMSKRVARKQALRRKRRAEAKAQKQQNNQEVNNNEVNNTEEKVDIKNSLIVYDENKANSSDQTDYSEGFLDLIQKIDGARKKFEENCNKADEIWKQAGDDQPCPQQAWDMFMQALTEFQKDIETLLQTDVSSFGVEELQTLETFTTAIDGYITKSNQQLMAIKPNLSLEDLEDKSTSIVPSNSTSIVSQQSTALTTVKGTDVETVDVSPLTDEPEKTKRVDIRSRKKIITREQFHGTWEKTKNILTGLKDAIGKLLKTGYIAFKKFKKPIDWFGEKLWLFITSPLARNLLKMFMYVNPLTKMIFDGDFGTFGFKKDLQKLKDLIGKKLDDAAKPAIERDKKDLPKDISNAKFKDIKKEFYGNKALIDLVNVSYNHPKVTTGDKAVLKKSAKDTARMIKLKRPDEAKKSFSELLRVCNKICDYMDWDKPIQWQNLITKFKAKGTTDREEKQIKKKMKKDKHVLSDAEYRRYQQLNQLANNTQTVKHESFIENFNRLLEEAER